MKKLKFSNKPAAKNMQSSLSSRNIFFFVVILLGLMPSPSFAMGGPDLSSVMDVARERDQEANEAQKDKPTTEAGKEADSASTQERDQTMTPNASPKKDKK